MQQAWSLGGSCQYVHLDLGRGLWPGVHCSRPGSGADRPRGLQQAWSLAASIYIKQEVGLAGGGGGGMGRQITKVEKVLNVSLPTIWVSLDNLLELAGALITCRLVPNECCRPYKQACSSNGHLPVRASQRTEQRAAQVGHVRTNSEQRQRNGPAHQEWACPAVHSGGVGRVGPASEAGARSLLGRERRAPPRGSVDTAPTSRGGSGRPRVALCVGTLSQCWPAACITLPLGFQVGGFGHETESDRAPNGRPATLPGHRCRFSRT